MTSWRCRHDARWDYRTANLAGATGWLRKGPRAHDFRGSRRLPLYA